MPNEVVNWTDELAKHAKDAAAIERPSLTNISVRGGVLRLNGVELPNSELDCVIVASIFENQYYEPGVAFDPDNLKNPICFAQSITGEDMAPSDAAAHKQNDACATCPQHQWGSGNKKGKACKEKRKLALLPASFIEAGQVKQAEMALLAIPVTSTKNWANYVNLLLNEHHRPPFGVLTRIKAKPHPKTQLEVSFSCVGLVGEQHLGDVLARKPGAEEILMRPYEGQPEDPTQSKEDNAKKKPKKY